MPQDFPLAITAAMAAAVDAAARARELAQQDEAARRREFLFALPLALTRNLRRALNDPRDEPCLLLLLNICATVVPAATLLHALRLQSHLLGAAYLVANYVLFLQRFLLALHFTEHRPLFQRAGERRLWQSADRQLQDCRPMQCHTKQQHGTARSSINAHTHGRGDAPWRAAPCMTRPTHQPSGAGRLLNCVAPYLLAPLYGVPSGAYRLHHVVMHHVEDNAAGWDLSATEHYQRDRLASFLG